MDGCGGVPAYLVLLRVGFTMRFCLRKNRCALTAPFHRCRQASASLLPLGGGIAAAARRLYHFCGTFRRVTPPGRYPASCPMEPGLSSPVRLSAGRPADSLAAATTRPPAAHSTSAAAWRQIGSTTCSPVMRRAAVQARHDSASQSRAEGLPWSIAAAIETVCCWRISWLSALPIYPRRRMRL